MHGQILSWQHDDQVELDPLDDGMILATDSSRGLDVLIRVEERLELGTLQILAEEVPLEGVDIVDQLGEGFLPEREKCGSTKYINILAVSTAHFCLE